MTQLEEKLLQMLEEERAKVDTLTNILLEQQGLIHKDLQVQVTPMPKFIGKIPWYKQKSILQRKYSSKSEPEIESEVQNNASEISETMGSNAG